MYSTRLGGLGALTSPLEPPLPVLQSDPAPPSQQTTPLPLVQTERAATLRTRRQLLLSGATLAQPPGFSRGRRAGPPIPALPVCPLPEAISSAPPRAPARPRGAVAGSELLSGRPAAPPAVGGAPSSPAPPLLRPGWAGDEPRTRPAPLERRERRWPRSSPPEVSRVRISRTQPGPCQQVGSPPALPHAQAVSFGDQGSSAPASQEIGSHGGEPDSEGTLSTVPPSH